MSEREDCALCGAIEHVTRVSARVVQSAEEPPTPDDPVVEIPICAACLEAVEAAA